MELYKRLVFPAWKNEASIIIIGNVCDDLQEYFLTLLLMLVSDIML